MDEGQLTAQLRPLEESLWRAETRFDDVVMNRLFAEDFIEFGRSGRVYARDEVFFGESSGSKIDVTFPLIGFQIRLLSPEIAQVTYVSEVRYGDEVERANRSSLWRRASGSWELCFHQGTAIA